MKVLHQRSYKHIGFKDGMHCFISIRSNFDPEILLLQRAIFRLHDNTDIYLGPVDKDAEFSNRIYTYKGTDSEGNRYCYKLNVQAVHQDEWFNMTNHQSAVRVNQLGREECIPKRRNVRFDNLIKTNY